MYKKLSLVTLAGLIVLLGFIGSRFFIFDDIRNFIAATFFTDSISVNYLKDKYTNAEQTGAKIRILLVPGHEPDFGGTEFGTIKERDINVDLAMKLKNNLERDKHFEAILTRDKEKWNPELKKYFNDNWSTIENFANRKKSEMKRLIDSGKVEKAPSIIQHNDAPKDVATRLFGINLWSRDIGIDVLVHIHFNDYPRAQTYLPGEHKGFAIYIPDKQYSNARATRAMATKIFERLQEFFVVSDLPAEDIGIVESQNLIAIGQSNTLDAVSILIEYGYIYRPQFTSQSSRKRAIELMAKQTYLGLVDALNTDFSLSNL